MHRDTFFVHAGYRKNREAGAFLGGPQFSSTFTTPGDPADHALTYGRFHNPTWSAWEAALGEMDGGEAVSFASGMAAVSAVLSVTLRPGDVAVLPADAYYTVRRIATDWFGAMGVQVRLASNRDIGQASTLQGAKLVWLETPSNPRLEISDIAAIAAAAKTHGAVVAVDNTTATAYLQQPLSLGATYVIASDTKGLTGHSDVILGHVSTADAERAAALRVWRTQHGAIPGPMEVWLAHRALPTLPLRSARQCATAQALAECLSTHERVDRVLYPGLPSHPGHDIARRQMQAFGSVLSFDLGSRARAEAFLGALEIVREATSFGGVHSMAERRARWGGDDVGEGFIRFSAGCEATEDIVADVRRALSGAS